MVGVYWLGIPVGFCSRNANYRAWTKTPVTRPYQWKYGNQIQCHHRSVRRNQCMVGEDWTPSLWNHRQQRADKNYKSISCMSSYCFKFLVCSPYLVDLKVRVARLTTDTWDLLICTKLCGTILIDLIVDWRANTPAISWRVSNTMFCGNK